MNISEELNILNTAKQDIKSAIIEKGQTVGDNMHEYADAIKNISGSEDTNDYLCFEAVEDSAISLSNYGGNLPNVEYSFDKQTWTIWDYSNIDILAGLKLYMRGDNPNGFNHPSNVYSTFNNSGNISVAGNVTTLLNPNGSDIIGVNSLQYLFRNNTHLIDASKLSFASKILNRGLANMFSGCTSLVNAPKMNEITELIPNSDNAGYHFYSMFSGCTSLINGPSVLQPLQIYSGTYGSMFDGCTNLVNAPYIMVNNNVNSCSYMFRNCSNLQYIKADILNVGGSYTYNWVSGVASTGVFIKNKNASWTTKGNDSCPSSWTLIKSVS